MIVLIIVLSYNTDDVDKIFSMSGSWYMSVMNPTILSIQQVQEENELCSH